MNSAQRLPQDGSGLHKAVVAQHFLAATDAFVPMGNHRVYASDSDPDLPSPHARIPAEALAVAHVPIRSAEQLTAKIAVGRLARLSAKRGNPALSFHWGEAYAALAAGHRLTVAELEAMAANYSVPRTQWSPVERSTWIDEPFLADIKLIYTRPNQRDALATILTFAQRLAGG